MQCSRYLRYTGIILLVLVLCVGPFLRGLFFWTELLAGIALTTLGFALWLAGRWLEGLPVHPTGGATGTALLALLACYLLQFAWAVYPRGNLDWVLRAAAAWAVYTLVRHEAGPILRRLLAWGLVLTAAGLSLWGFLEFTGYLAKDPEAAQALNLVEQGTRMFTPLQYPNTAAAYLLAALLAAMGLAAEDWKLWKGALLSGLMTLISLAFFFTASRGAVVVLPFGLAIFFAGLQRGKRWPALLLLLAACVPMVLAQKGVGANAAIQNGVSAFRWIGAATTAGVLAGIGLHVFLRLRLRLQLALVGAAIILAVGAVVAFRPAGGLLPKQAARLLDINFRTANVTYRLALDRDGLRMTADRPLGRGGAGWDRSYHQYQSWYYVGRETHNHYLQTAVEAGVPGLLVLLAALGTAMWAAWKNRTGTAVGWSLAAAAILVAGHSLIDFDLSYGAVWLAFWAWLGAAAEPLTAPRQRAAFLWGTAGAGLATAAFAAVLMLGAWYADRADALAEDQPEAARAAAVRATRLDPWNSTPLLVLADQAALEKATRVDPNLPSPHFDLAVKLQNQNDWEGALREARLAVKLHPMVSAYYTKVAAVSGTLMVDALYHGDFQRARELAGELKGLGDGLLRRIATGKTGPWMGTRLVMDPVVKLRYGQALFLAGDPAGATPYLAEAAKVGLLGSEADVWLYAIYERQGNKQGMDGLANQPWIRFRGSNPVYKAIKDWQE